jgi:uncharacterized DUF497 family protein
MEYEWDDAKCRANIAKHDIHFEDAEGFEWGTAIVTEDTREDYGERRFHATGEIGGRLHFLVFTRRSAKVRIISLRRANQRDRRKWENHHA